MADPHIETLDQAAREAILARVWAKVNRRPEPDGCWEWTASLTNVGYGQLNVHGKPRTVHRLVYLLCVGPVAPGLFVCHRCDNRKCCRPDHLFVGTPMANSEDMVRKGRSTKGRPSPPGAARRGEQHGMAKLNADQVREIRRSHAAGATYAELARRFGISDAHAYGIVARLYWKCIPAEDEAAVPALRG